MQKMHPWWDYPFNYTWKSRSYVFHAESLWFELSRSFYLVLNECLAYYRCDDILGVVRGFILVWEASYDYWEWGWLPNLTWYAYVSCPVNFTFLTNRWFDSTQTLNFSLCSQKHSLFLPWASRYKTCISFLFDFNLNATYLYLK